MMRNCYLGLGSNLGNRKRNINLAIKKIMSLPSTQVKKCSSIIETAPVGGPIQPNFLNAVLWIKTGLSARRLLSSLQDIEKSLGRVRGIKNGPRTIDLDILLYGNQQIKEPDLVIPHPRMLRRKFVMQPLQEVAPQLVRRLRLAHSQRPAKADKGNICP